MLLFNILYKFSAIAHDKYMYKCTQLHHKYTVCINFNLRNTR